MQSVHKDMTYWDVRQDQITCKGKSIGVPRCADRLNPRG